MSNKQSPRNFWASVDRGGHDKCWEWQGSVNSTGYGTVAWFGKVYTAHRSAAWLSEMVDDLNAPTKASTPTHVLHKCDNRKCCNPRHFFLGSYTDNMNDAYKKRRKTQPKGEKHTNAKLTNAQAEDIRCKYSAGATQSSLSKEYGVSQVAISLIIRKVTYND
jgi:hypothetical protein